MQSDAAGVEAAHAPSFLASGSRYWRGARLPLPASLGGTHRAENIRRKALLATMSAAPSPRQMALAEKDSW